MQKFQTLQDAVALATFAHKNQQDKAGFPYIEHPLRVLETVKAMGGRPFVQVAAVLHDVTEDTAFTHEMLTELGFSPPAVQLVRLVDRKETRYWYNLYKAEDSMTEYEFYYDRIKMNADAKMIKVADIRDNTAPWRLSYLPEETQARLNNKYAKAMELLNG